MYHSGSREYPVLCRQSSARLGPGESEVQVQEWPNEATLARGSD